MLILGTPLDRVCLLWSTASAAEQKIQAMLEQVEDIDDSIAAHEAVEEMYRKGKSRFPLSNWRGNWTPSGSLWLTT